MKDKQLLNLFLDRNDLAVDATAKSYGKVCKDLAYSILRNNEDAEECVNDAYLQLWKTIPPEHPPNLKAYLLRILRHISYKRVRSQKDEKQNLYLEELLREMDQISPQEAAETKVLNLELSKRIEAFLRTLPSQDSDLFLLRYWYACTYREIATLTGLKENTAIVKIGRIKEKLFKELRKEGYYICTKETSSKR